MKKKYKDFVVHIFSERIKQIGYILFSCDKSNYVWKYEDKGELSIILTEKHVQFFIKKNNSNRKIFSLKTVSLFGLDEAYSERMKKAMDIFYFDTFEEFEGIFCLCYDVLKRNSIFFSDLITDEIIEKSVKEIISKEKEGLTEDEFIRKKMIENLIWIEKVRFTDKLDILV